MKKIKCLFILLLFGGLYQSCMPDIELSGSIYGTVEDKATGEPIKSVWVELLPSGLKTTTGSDGAFEFIEIDFSFILSGDRPQRGTITYIFKLN